MNGGLLRKLQIHMMMHSWSTSGETSRLQQGKAGEGVAHGSFKPKEVMVK
jgi:hypothetical protein